MTTYCPRCGHLTDAEVIEATPTGLRVLCGRRGCDYDWWEFLAAVR